MPISAKPIDLSDMTSYDPAPSLARLNGNRKYEFSLSMHVVRERALRKQMLVFDINNPRIVSYSV